VGTSGARDTMRYLEQNGGGTIDDQEFTILVATAAFGEVTPPGDNRQTITVCVDAHGIPCAADRAVGSRVTARIVSVTRAGGGLTFTLTTEQRG
jgi:hypothetical protein